MTTKKTASKKAPAKKAVVPVAPVKTEAELVKEARALWGPLANKTRAYLVFVNENKDLMPNEYAFAKSLIERYIK